MTTATGLFAAGAAKVFNPAEFVSAIEGYRVVGPPWTVIGGYYLPWLEIVTALALFGKSTRQVAWVLAGAFALIFLAGVFSAWIRELDISCGCFGTGSTIDGFTVLRNTGLLAIVVLGAWFDRE
ncbi:MAG: hypothetical protein SynsKO_04230 [Synoicihabitans sp.]